ncbi:hypothetical protein [Rhodopirellula sp. MGV]|uniref:hypothetical protein n=1 Tax=Rhodopirellula sp. MGV TaxID=2023130 RepID=UPI000B97C05A|nr:hypothetical protein [Rhodopirellula sp. MGV]OYP37204.1 hypothetical protein CGZ80_05805 [Rhodopirellula sp. MGV]PNY37981.1 hypothetical protein C2E31_05655 [Rhodopirellula baltica]
MTQVGFEDDGSGNLQLADEEFHQAVFPDLTIMPRQGRSVVLKNVKFIDCEVRPGTCVITSDVVLDSVVFSNLDCGDSLTISSKVRFRRVIVAGDRPVSLVVQPESEGDLVVQSPDNDDFQLDVSRFNGSVCVIGLPGSKIVKDSSRHVLVNASWKTDVDWKTLRIGPFSYWRILLKKLSVFNASEGVFSLPLSTDKNYAETIDEMKRMENAGVCVR